MSGSRARSYAHLAGFFLTGYDGTEMWVVLLLVALAGLDDLLGLRARPLDGDGHPVALGVAHDDEDHATDGRECLLHDNHLSGLQPLQAISSIIP